MNLSSKLLVQLPHEGRSFDFTPRTFSGFVAFCEGQSVFVATNDVSAPTHPHHRHHCHRLCSVGDVCLPAWATLLLMPAFTLIQSHVLNVSQTWSIVSSVTFLTATFWKRVRATLDECWMSRRHDVLMKAWVWFVFCASSVFLTAARSDQSYSLGRQQDYQVNTGPLYPSLSPLGVVSPPLDQQMGASPHRPAAQLQQDWASFNYTKHRGALVSLQSDSALKLHVFCFFFLLRDHSSRVSALLPDYTSHQPPGFIPASSGSLQSISMKPPPPF